jgi:hypothetical protein
MQCKISCFTIGPVFNSILWFVYILCVPTCVEMYALKYLEQKECKVQMQICKLDMVPMNMLKVLHKRIIVQRMC